MLTITADSRESIGSRPLNVLVIEDRLPDTELMLHQLREAGFGLDWQQVETEDEFFDCLAPEVDVILADYSLPQFDAMRALQLLDESGLNIPLIVVTGSISEEIAVECMKRGAADYLLKESLVRLAPAVQHAIEERKLREEKLKAESDLRESEKRFRLLADNVTDVIWTMDLELNLTYITPSVEGLLGYSVEEALWQSLEDILTPESLAAARRVLMKEMIWGIEEEPETCQTRSMELEYIHKQGSTIWTEVRLSFLRDEQGVPIGILGVMRDITERKMAREELLRREAHYRSLIENGSEIITILDSDGTIRYESPSLERTLGYKPDELIGKNIFEFIHSDDVPGILKIFAEHLRIPGIGPIVEISFQHKDGSWKVLESRANNLLHDPVISGIVVNSHDVTDRNQAEEELRYLSTHDALTGLFNRAFFEAEVSRLQRSRQFPVSVMMVDVDGLKDTNDNEGHAAGDDLLRTAASLLQSAFRAEDIIARIGGDEFAILLPMTDSAAANRMLERVRKTIAGHARERHALRLSLSLGAATANTPAMLADALKQADRRMYRDKSERAKPRDTGPLRIK